MAAPGVRVAHFVLDHNFPRQVTELPWPPSIKLSRLVDQDAALIRGYDDWEVLRELARRGGVDGFVTNDAKILRLPREMVMLAATALTMVVTDGVGHDPVRATGLVMVSLV